MAALPPIKQIRAEDVMGADGALDGEKLIGLLNQFMLGVYTALDGKLDSNNLAAETRTLTFRTQSTVADTFPIYFPLERLTAFRHVIATVYNRSSDAAALGTAVSADVRPTGNGRAEVRNIAGLTADTQYEVRLLLLP